jgi:hypothetical protein
MEKHQQETLPMKNNSKIYFDKSMLTDRQRQAFDIAQAQGPKSYVNFEEILMDIEPRLMHQLRTAIMNSRKEDRDRQQRS